MSEARTGKRFPLELPIKIHKEEGGGEHSGLTGKPERRRCIHQSRCALEMGSTVEFEITLPPEMTGAKEGVVIQCRGRVVRTDEPDGGSPTEARGVACVIDSYDFVRH